MQAGGGGRGEVGALLPQPQPAFSSFSVFYTQTFSDCGLETKESIMKRSLQPGCAPRGLLLPHARHTCRGTAWGSVITGSSCWSWPCGEDPCQGSVPTGPSPNSKVPGCGP